MVEYVASVRWDRGGGDFSRGRYSRGHAWEFDGGAVVRGSSSPHHVPEPWSDPAAVDPEEAFVAAIASCHMLWFLSLAAKHGFIVDRYEDRAVGTMAPDVAGRIAVTRCVLDPQIAWGGAHQPAAAEVAALHHAAHEACFIAASVKTEIVVAGE